MAGQNVVALRLVEQDLERPAAEQRATPAEAPFAPQGAFKASARMSLLFILATCGGFWLAFGAVAALVFG